MALTRLQDALPKMLSQISVVPHTEEVLLMQAHNRCIAEDVFATIQVPPMDNSAMDGYAICCADIAEGLVLKVSQRIPAGAVAQALQPGTAARIFTGAEIPPGADAVVMQENTQPVEDGVRILQIPRVGENIRAAGNDMDIGQHILSAGQRLRAQELGLLASLGFSHVVVKNRPIVGVLCTGSELVEPGQPLEVGQIYNSNRFVITSLLQGWGCDVRQYEVVEDTLVAVKKALQLASQQCDFIISSGGVSVGEEDHVRAAVEALGSLSLWRLAIKPGKPVAFGEVAGVPFLGLPGNPSSSFVTSLLVARPLIKKLSGALQQEAVEINVAADFDLVSPGSREEYLRVKLIHVDNSWRAIAYPNQSSGALTAASWGNALVRVPIGQTIAKGDQVRALLFDSLLN